MWIELRWTVGLLACMVPPSRSIFVSPMAKRANAFVHREPSHRAFSVRDSISPLSLPLKDDFTIPATALRPQTPARASDVDAAQRVGSNQDPRLSDTDDDDKTVGFAQAPVDAVYDPFGPQGPLAVDESGRPWLRGLLARARRNRKNVILRRMLCETIITPSKLIQPLFIHNQEDDVEIPSMPGCYRYGPKGLIKVIKEAASVGVRTFILFPAIDKSLKTPDAAESYNPNGLIPQTLLKIKSEVPNVVVITDVALDPYNSMGHDGLVDDKGIIDNDATLDVICKQGLVQAKFGADVLGPSEMMDGRVYALRTALDSEGFRETNIMSYACKFASALYGPFRDALQSHVAFGDKKTYQMDPANVVEAIRDGELDKEEGADILMVKPGTFYLDIISKLAEKTRLPIAAYHVSGEYSMIKAAAEKGWLDEKRVALEAMRCMLRAGASVVLSYFAKDLGKWICSNPSLMEVSL